MCHVSLIMLAKSKRVNQLEAVVARSKQTFAVLEACNSRPAFMQSWRKGVLLERSDESNRRACAEGVAET